MQLHNQLRRVQLHVFDEGKTYDEVAALLSSHKRVLCIVNTRKDAKELYQRLPQEGFTLHLSRMMCPIHVGETIQKVKSVLAANPDAVIRVVATQLIEAGVDIDFPVVYRQAAGLDSVLQAAGRCNREGRQTLGVTHVFSINGRNPHGSIQDGNQARLALSAENDWFAPATMTEYFKQLYCRKDTFDQKDICHYLYKPTEMCFETASQEFRLIDDTGRSVIVNWQDSLSLVQQLQTCGPSYGLMKQLSKYTVSVTQNDFKDLLKGGFVEEVVEGVFVVKDEAQYSESVGLHTDNHWLEEIHII
jgi:CRISPR-associated endonuclease/helicase Cas3